MGGGIGSVRCSWCKVSIECVATKCLSWWREAASREGRGLVAIRISWPSLKNLRVNLL